MVCKCKYNSGYFSADAMIIPTLFPTWRFRKEGLSGPEFSAAKGGG